MTKPNDMSISCVGIIIDGNRRWAKLQGKTSLHGHQAGYKRLKECVRWARDASVAHLIVYVFSTENWNRSPEEVAHLTGLLEEVFERDAELKKLSKEGVRLRIVGQRNRFSDKAQKAMQKVEEESKGVEGFTLTLALSYGGRAEILDAVKRTAAQKSPEEISELTQEEFSDMLWTSGIPDPDIIIRTGGEQRLSNFLPWQATYSELFFTDTLWPAFTREEFEEILQAYAKRERRKGK